MNNLFQIDDAVVTSPHILPRRSARRGDRRTETVGHSKNGNAIAILHDASDARSDVSPDADGAAGAADVTAELEAILAVGQALARLQNPAARQRVLNWAVQRFDAGPDENAGPDEAAEPDENVPARMSMASDPMLAVDDLSDLFDNPLCQPLSASDLLDEPLGDLFELPAVGLLPAPPSEGMPSAAGHTPWLKVLVLHFVHIVNVVRRVALDARSHETASVSGRT